MNITIPNTGHGIFAGSAVFVLVCTSTKTIPTKIVIARKKFTYLYLSFACICILIKMFNITNQKCYNAWRKNNGNHKNKFLLKLNCIVACTTTDKCLVSHELCSQTKWWDNFTNIYSCRSSVSHAYLLEAECTNLQNAPMQNFSHTQYL